MDITFFIKGLIIGFSIAALVGPIAILCVQRTLAHGRISGLLTGLGAATADGIYGAIAAFSLTVISNFLVGQQFWFRLIGGAFLLYLGLKTLLSKLSELTVTDNHKSLSFDFFSTVFLTISNPITIISFIAVFAGVGLGGAKGNTSSATLMTLGVFLGSALWWIILTWGVNYLKTKFKFSSLKIVNKISGLILIAFAIFAFVSIFTN